MTPAALIRAQKPSSITVSGVLRDGEFDALAESLGNMKDETMKQRDSELATLRAELAAVKARAEQADAEATERACRVMCYFCAHPDEWGPAEVISFGNYTQSFMHRNTGSESKYNLLKCAAFMIREAAAKAKGGDA